MYVDRRRCEQSSSCIAVINRCTEDAAAAAVAAVAVIYIHLATTQDGSWLRKKRRR